MSGMWIKVQGVSSVVSVRNSGKRSGAPDHRRVRRTASVGDDDGEVPRVRRSTERVGASKYEIPEGVNPDAVLLGPHAGD
jgi:hypothetical protein